MVARTVAAGICTVVMAAAQIVFPGSGKHIVLVSGDDEYRSEEALPQLAKILSQRHGFRCTVLFAIDPADGTVKPDLQNNIPGLEALRTADLMVLFTRFRDLPDAQMKHIVDYLESGRPIVAMRTSTHAFQLKSSPTYARFSWNDKETGGFGRAVLGETWINHHGKHGAQSTRGLIAPGAEGHPILRGIRSGDVWGPSDVYKVRLPLPGDSLPLVLGQVVNGMRESDPPAEGALNDPMMPVAWTRTYRSARVFTTTMGASEDLLNEGVRRMLVNACYWALKMEDRIRAELDVGLVGEYRPSHFSFGGHVKGRTPDFYALPSGALSVSLLEPHNATLSEVEYRGRSALRVVAQPGAANGASYAIVKGTSFHNGALEVDVAGKPAAGAGEGARGFIGLAFRMKNGKYEHVYLRPTNGRADDQVRRNHSTQYSSHPDYDFARFRKESPEKYESYVDLEAGAWTKFKLAVEGTQARLYVHGAEQPCLIVNDLKLGDVDGAVALWVGPGTEGYFSNLRIAPAPR